MSPTLTTARSFPVGPPLSKGSSPSGSMLQSFFAQAAIFFLPLPAMKYTSTTITVADLFLVPAILMNLGYALQRVHAFQIPLLLAFPLLLLSHLLDPDAQLIPVLQVCYLWGFLVPFGWCAFVNVPLRRIALLLLAANGISSVVAIVQFVGYLPPLPTQHIIIFKSALRRAAGLTLQCNTLSMALTPCFLLLPYLPRVWPRIVTCLLLMLGFITTVSKSMIMAGPGLLFYFLWREPQKWRLIQATAVLVGLVMFGLHLRGNAPLEVWDLVNDAAAHRLDYADHSFEERSDLVRIALEYSKDCLLLGYGSEGTQLRISQASGNTVHVFYLGLVVIAGYPAAILIVLGFLLICANLWRQREYNVAIYVVAHMLSLTVMTVLYLSFQTAPFLIAASVMVANDMRAKQARHAFPKRAPLSRASTQTASASIPPEASRPGDHVAEVFRSTPNRASIS